MCVRTSTAFYGRFILSMDRSPGFGSMYTDYSHFSHLVSLRLRTFQYFTSPVYITRRTVLQKVRDRSHMELSQLADTGFQVLFHSPPGVLFTFPSRYYSLSVTKEYLALRGGPRSFRQGFTCLVLLWILSRFARFRIRDFHALWLRLSMRILLTGSIDYTVRTPESKLSGLGSSAFARRYLRNHFCFLFLRLLRCFSSPGSLHIPMYSACDTRSLS